MLLFATKDILIDSLRSAGKEKDELASGLLDDIVELKRELEIMKEALMIVDIWLTKERLKDNT